MDERKAELVDRLNAINKRIEEQWYAVDKKLLEVREKIKQELDLYSNRHNDGNDRRNGWLSRFMRKGNRL